MHKNVWLGAIAALGIIDIWCAVVKKDGTLSKAGRETFRTDTTPGKVIWVAFWVTLSGWLVPHILKGANRILS